MLKKFLWVAAFCLMMVAGCEGFNPVGPLLQLGIFWYQGEAHKYYHTGRDVAVSGVKASLDALDLPVQSEREDGDSVYLQAGGQGDKRFKIRIKRVKDQTTMVSVRVNVFGDRPYAELLFRNLDRQPGMRDFVSEEELRREAR